MLEIFSTSVALLRKATAQMVMAGPLLDMIKTLLQLNRACMNFDFIGSSIDESSDDQRTAQVPIEWRDVILAPDTLQLFFNLYINCGPPISHETLACLVQFASGLSFGRSVLS